MSAGDDSSMETPGLDWERVVGDPPSEVKALACFYPIGIICHRGRQ